MENISVQRRMLLRTAAAGAVMATVGGCGGGGGGGSSSATAPAAAPPVTPPVVQPSTTVAFTGVSVHDPSVIKAAETYYVFGSHLAAARSTDWMNWTRIADGVNAGNPLFNNVTAALSEALAWAQADTLWAPDVARLDDGKFYMYYCACKGDSPRSALGLAVADKVDGPYVNKQLLLKSGMWGEASPDGTVYDATKHPNVVDPNVFRDNGGKLWMVYGSYSGGIFIMEMNPATGLQKPAQGYGRHLMGGNHARIEGAYILYSPDSKYYYLFVSFGGLDANGGYNIRVSRSLNPDGPYVDGAGTDMATVKANPALPLFDDASIAPHGQKLMGNHQYVLASGETGTALGYVSPGHNSAYYDVAAGKYFLVFHARFPGQGEAHEVRVHEMFINVDGWPVVAPFRYVPLSKNAITLSADVSAADAAGIYKVINHGKDISAVIKQSQVVTLAAGGAVSGAIAGNWSHLGGNKVSIVSTDGTAYNGVLSRQWNTNGNAFEVTFTVQSKAGVSLWGARMGN
ncbi:glycoside hydrolase family 43 protein [Duganella sp. Root336D2]|uniref:glycoside hydrolase family 43 protein n=1 Tax=Duganella sp. Root336D2 TaxID=1736518 RepID=UPI0009EBCA76|nr:glycoside hydrolase family 43 protein [Duganella sp. Root336D2]